MLSQPKILKRSLKMYFHGKINLCQKLKNSRSLPLPLNALFSYSVWVNSVNLLFLKFWPIVLDQRPQLKHFKVISFFFCSTGVWTQVLHLEPLQHFLWRFFFKIGSHELWPSLASNQDPLEKLGLQAWATGAWLTIFWLDAISGFVQFKQIKSC
jgi:hypothetical protein